jgi:hypothetical protein
MMETLRVARVRARYRLPAGEADSRARLDRLLREVSDEALDHALSRCGVPTHEEICVRAVRAPVELRLTSPDSTLVAAWSVALAGSIGEVIAAGGPDVVRYRSRTHALADLVLGVAARDLRRAWAWRQLDLWRIGDAPPPAAAAAETVRALLAAPGSIVPALAAAARAGALSRLVQLFPLRAWSGLVAAALDARALPAIDEPHGLRTGSVDEVEMPDVVEERADRIVAASAIAGAMRALPDGEPELRRLLAVLAILEVEPTELGRGPARARQLLSAIERDAVAALVTGPDPSRRESASPAPASAAVRPYDRRAPAPDQRESARPEDRAEATREEASDDLPLPELPRAAGTEWGGLLFLLHVVDELRLPAGILRDEVFRARTLRWVLHRLAMRLTGAAERDAACLAFAATPPDEAPPSEGEEPPSDEEEGAIGELAARVATRLHERVRDEPAPDAAARALARSVARRSARISCTPGWFDVLLRLDEVSVEVRRAGLDLDPGWIPWLGAVVRFVYE